MLRNYFTIMFRNFARRKFYSSVNVLCLTVGITFALLIGIFIKGELQVNQDLKDVDRLYLLQSKFKTDRGNFEWFAPGLLTKYALDQYPTTFEKYYRFFDRNITISKDDKHFRIQSMIGDPSLLEIFGFTVLHGDAVNPLKAPNSMVITDKVAKQYFSKTDVAGETLTVSTEQNGRKDYKITAIIQEPQDRNSVSDFMNMDARVFISLENRHDFFSENDPETWVTDIISYVKLAPFADAKNAETILNDLLKKNAPIAAENRNIVLNPLENYYLITNHGAVRKLIVSLTVVVIFILLLAITNFINISIASSFSRLKEVGVRKVIGGVKNQVVVQFLLEASVYSLCAGVLALLLYELLHEYFGRVLNSALPSLLQFDQIIWISILAGIISIGILAGIYPAIYQSATKAIDSLKGKLRSVNGNLLFSRGLITTQFLITLFIFTGAIILSKQVNFFLEKDLGFDKSQVLIVTSVPRLFNEEGFQKMESAKQAFLGSSKIKDVSLSWGAPGWNFSPFDLDVFRLENSVDAAKVRSSLTSADEDYLNVFDIKLAEGEFLQTAQLDKIVLNRAAKKALAAEIGDQVKFQGDDVNVFTVGGIVEDFNFESLHEPIKPVVFMHTKALQMYRFFSFKLEPGSLTESVSEVEQLWRKTFPNDPFDYSFTDEKLKALYTTEVQLKKASSIATTLMIIIVLTGVLGLVSLNVSKRIKEIGIRKVLGASVSNILSLISREYAILMSIAFVLSTPLAYLAADYWLNNFAYHIDVKWWMFVIPIVSLFIITTLIVCIQSIGTALANPVKSLRYE